MKTVSLMLIIFILTFVNNNYSKHIENKISNLHKTISHNLLKFKKEYPQTQPQVYSLLDLIYKMYQLSKTAIQKKKDLKTKLTISNKNIFLIKTENIALKQKLKNLKEELDSKIKTLENKNKTLVKNTTMLNILTKEKQKMETKINNLKEEQRQIILKSQNSNKDETFTKLNHKLEGNLTNTINQAQNINLTSTWAPSSPL